MSHQNLSAVPDLAFVEKLLQPSTPYPAVCLKFKASWCGPCKRIDMERLIKLNPNIKWFEVDADENGDVLEYCGVSSIPCFLAIKNGKPQPLFQSSDTQKVADWLYMIF